MYIAQSNGVIKTFRDLSAWQEAHRLVIEVYKITDEFPSKENFALTSQMRRAAVSITSNIAEGFSRRGSKEKAHFLSLALGSLTELQSQILTSRDVGYINHKAYSDLDQQTVIIHKLINGLIKSAGKLKPLS